MKAHYARVESEVFGVVTTNSLHVEFFPTISIFGVGGVSVCFSQWRDVSFVLFVTRIDARTRRVEITFDAIDTRGFDAVEIDQRVVANDDGLVVFDEADTAHVRS